MKAALLAHSQNRALIPFIEVKCNGLHIKDSMSIKALIDRDCSINAMPSGLFVTHAAERGLAYLRFAITTALTLYMGPLQSMHSIRIVKSIPHETRFESQAVSPWAQNWNLCDIAGPEVSLLTIE